ncbi:MAG: tRNA dimethylallyltransferase [Candidatus Pseudothioglobus sp.]|jgi:tRNA dimethylallyltransferase
MNGSDTVRPPAIFLMGPTASGKSGLAMMLADELPVEIISVDSAMVYRQMDIGTAKPDSDTLAYYPHHLVNIREPDMPYSAADFCADVLPLMASITARGRIPLLVGGTMLYFKALLQGLATMPPADTEVRSHIAALAQQHSWAYVHSRLQEVDPLAAARIHPNDPQRIGRALEVFEITGQSMTAWHAAQTAHTFPYRSCQLAIVPPDRIALHQQIAQRFAQMLDAGLVDEVDALRQRYPAGQNLPALKAVGYRQVWQHLEGRLTYKQMQDQGIIATRQLAKRQFTWLRKWPDLRQIVAPDKSLALKILRSSIILT